MLKSDLKFDYPKSLVATERKPPTRVMRVENGEPSEISKEVLLSQISSKDLLVINETKVIPARVISKEGLEILFIENQRENQWQVLCPARKWPKGKGLELPGGIHLKLVKTGLPQIVEANQSLDENYFFEFGEMPLPPYIQEARGERRQRSTDRKTYQTAWAETLGSLAAPTASLHFMREDIHSLLSRGVSVEKICLHVGLGTFLPIHADNLEDHKMHSEQVSVSKSTWEKINKVKKEGGKIWAMGSTVTRALESVAGGLLPETNGSFSGNTTLFIKPGYKYQIVDRLMTNFHQPESTLIAMVMAFAGVESTKSCYQWAIKNEFRLFSYGDLSVWLK